ncbi:MAG: GMC family oxidoreductase [Anaerolineales bacterium]|nr:GMC family oxidoreductase [Anaerolineales bacterium]
MKETYDYVIVGSGTAGGLLAYNLTQAGARCLLIEAGKNFRKETFPRLEGDASAQMYWGGGFELSHDASMAFLRGKVVGGGSIVNQGLMDRFDEVAFDDWRAESGVDFFSLAAMAPYYDAVEAKLALHTFTAVERNQNAEKFVAGCEACGYEWKYLRRGQADCGLEEGNDCIGCLNGCHRDSKQSSMVVFVRPAEALGLELVTETEVEWVEPAGEVVRVHASQAGTAKTYQARRLILSGGALGTTAVLLRSGFKPRYPALGKYFASHPQFMFFAIYDEEINAHQGYFQTVNSKDPRFRPRGFKLENVFAGPASSALLFTGYGRAHHQIMRQYCHMACAEVAIRDENAGEIEVGKNGRLAIKKQLTDQDRRRMKDGTAVLKEILAASGARQVIESPLYFGLHLMGGSRMGTDPATSVVEPDYKLRGFDNIYVCDSSLYPNAPGINPALTVMALSQRLSEQLTRS